MRKLSIAALIALAFTSCAKEPLFQTVNIKAEKNDVVVQLDTKFVLLKEGDKLRFTSEEYSRAYVKGNLGYAEARVNGGLHPLDPFSFKLVFEAK